MKFCATVSSCSIYDGLHTKPADSVNICLRFGSLDQAELWKRCVEPRREYSQKLTLRTITLAEGFKGLPTRAEHMIQTLVWRSRSGWWKRLNRKSYIKWVTVYLTHSLVPLASCTDLGVGDVEVPSVHLSAPLITDDGQVDRLQDIIVAGAWKRSRLDFMASVLV